VNIIVVTSWCAGKNPSSLAVTKWRRFQQLTWDRFGVRRNSEL